MSRIIDDSQFLITLMPTATRFYCELYEDTQYLKLSTFLYTFHISNGYHKGKCDTEGCKELD